MSLQHHVGVPSGRTTRILWWGGMRHTAYDGNPQNSYFLGAFRHGEWKDGNPQNAYVLGVCWHGEGVESTVGAATR